MFRPSLLVLAIACGLATFAKPHAVGADDKIDPEIEKLIKDMKNKDVKVRLKAADALRAKGEEAAPASKALCDALIDLSPKVNIAALEALEKVRPDLYKPLSTMLLDGTRPKQLEAVKELGLMGEKALPVTNVLLTRLRKELAGRTNRYRYGLSEFELAYFTTIKLIKPNDPDTIKLYKSMASGANQDALRPLASA